MAQSDDIKPVLASRVISMLKAGWLSPWSIYFPHINEGCRYRAYVNTAPIRGYLFEFKELAAVVHELDCNHTTVPKELSRI